MSKLLRMENIGKSFGVVRALDGVSLELDGGEVLALMGENGAGKSTLMNILSGALVHYEGRIFIDDQQVQIGSPLAARALGIAKIHQELQMAKELSIAENMFMGREKANRLGLVDKRAQEEEARKYLKMLELDLNPHRQLKTLRVGEQQMVEIAKALSLHARILILDEPTSAISKQETEQLFRVIRRLQSEGVGIIYITHRMEEVFEIADKLEVLRDGRYIDTVDARQVDRDQIISMMVGREIKDMYPKEEVPIGDEVLRVEHMHLNTCECLFGVHPAQCTGDIYIEGKKVSIKSPRDAIDLGLSFATEDRKGKGLVLLRSIGENMSLPLLKKFTKGLVMDTAAEGSLLPGPLGSSSLYIGWGTLYKLSAYLIQLGDSLCALRVRDVLAAWEMVRKWPEAERVCLYAQGEMSRYAELAALVRGITCHTDALCPPYEEIVTEKYHDQTHTHAWIFPGVLRHTDTKAMRDRLSLRGLNIGDMAETSAFTQAHEGGKTI